MFHHGDGGVIMAAPATAMADDAGSQCFSVFDLWPADQIEQRLVGRNIGCHQRRAPNGRAESGVEGGNEIQVATHQRGYRGAGLGSDELQIESFAFKDAVLLRQVDGKIEDVFSRKTEGRTLQLASGFSAVLSRDGGHVKQRKQGKRDAYETPE